VIEADGAAQPGPIESGAALFDVLKERLGYCACAYTDAAPFLHELLRRVAERTDSVHDSASFSRVSQELEEWLLAQSESGVASWIVYGLEKAGLLYHGWNVFDLSITIEGRRILAALDRFPDPEPGLGGLDGADADDDREPLTEDEIREIVKPSPPPFRFRYDD
jgi:hypothetical protein